MINKKHALHLLAALALLPALQGCLAVAAVAVAVGYVQYDRNEYEEELPMTQARVFQAVQHSLDTLGYPVEREITATETEAVVEVDDVWVRVEKLPHGKSRLRVRIGTFATEDHQRRARLIVEEVHRDLGMDPPVFEDAEEDEPAQPAVDQH